MEKLLFKDGQTLQVQSITTSNGTLRVNVINNNYEQLKHLFTDPLTTGRIAVEGEDGGEAEVFENYTIFSFIRENAGGIFIVEMQQDGEDTDTKLEKLKTDMEKLKEQSNPLINSAVLVAQIQAQSLTDEQAIAVKDIYPVWEGNGVSYQKDFYLTHNGKLYKVLQAHTSQEDWAPDAAPSLFAEVLPGQDGTGIGEWARPGSTNPYMIGDRVTHNGKTWESLVDNNVWEPGAQGSEALWKEVETE